MESKVIRILQDEWVNPDKILTISVRLSSEESFGEPICQYTIYVHLLDVDGISVRSINVLLPQGVSPTQFLVDKYIKDGVEKGFYGLDKQINNYIWHET